MRVIERGAILTRGSEIVWVGEESDAPLALDGRPDSGAAAAEGIRGEASPTEVVALGAAWVTPGLIDCHTHLVLAGTRADEYAERLRGLSYAEIARRGGGILSTMRAVRAASEQQLVDESAP